MSREPKFYAIPSGTASHPCQHPGCDHELYMVPTGNFHPDGKPKRMPVTVKGHASCKAPAAGQPGVGISHFGNCEGAASFRREKGKG